MAHPEYRRDDRFSSHQRDNRQADRYTQDDNRRTQPAYSPRERSRSPIRHRTADRPRHRSQNPGRHPAPNPVPRAREVPAVIIAPPELQATAVATGTQAPVVSPVQPPAAMPSASTIAARARMALAMSGTSAHHQAVVIGTMQPPANIPSISTIAARARMALVQAQSARPSMSNRSVQNQAQSRPTMPAPPVPTTSHPAPATSSSMQNSISLENVAQLLQHINAGRPTEQSQQAEIRRLQTEVKALQALHPAIRLLKEENKSLQAQLAQARMEADSIPRLVEAYTAIKRGNMMHDLMGLHKDFLPADLTAGSDVYKSQATTLVDIVTAMQDSYLKYGISVETLTEQDAKPLFATQIDKDWLMEQLEDGLTSTHNIWQLPLPKGPE